MVDRVLLSEMSKIFDHTSRLVFQLLDKDNVKLCQQFETC